MKKNAMKKIFLKLKNEYLGRGFATFCGAVIVILTFSIIFFLTTKGLNTFIKHGYSIFHFIFSGEWNPEVGGESLPPQFGTLIFILGSSAVSFLAVLVSAPIGVALAVFMNVVSPKLGTKVLQPAIELFVGIPSVVYGWIGVSVLVPIIKLWFGGIGFSLLAGVLVISVMILPTITSIASDAIKTIPKDYIEASYGLGATRWQTIIKVIIPASKSGILTGIVLGVSRAFGEALAVQMVIGNSVAFPKGLLGTTSTLTSILTMDMANTIYGTAWNDALWSMALLLLIISFVFILIIRKLGRRGEV
ncbi:phosphate ABC transporter permease subunit PstC [Clostridium sp. CF011]|uniref:phosphate ABC transporter permease subunit PstC n=1 Tax=Clostridium TaxID=1485 RepID=UPI0013EE9D39|nr:MULTISPECIES: phosphate ABC transporter permease subunit PstC [Clostridium]MBU3091953.1 phosphate ABC transporter permease subunit PstC [Clostridium sp. CF011]MBZ9608058.1 phosphate ABC transporter permease subunit PstC [Clostridium estertheticum]WAG70468.1 phosphate ABC transporter permease subunit PstC [Clostridium sp. CF011]